MKLRTIVRGSLNPSSDPTSFNEMNKELLLADVHVEQARYAPLSMSVTANCLVPNIFLHFSVNRRR
jgi:hypothetical protein